MGFLQGKTAIITGGGRAVLESVACGSIGYGIATAYAKEGANLVLTGRNMQKLLDAKEELERIAPQGKIALSPQPRQLESGFVLAYGPVELDCTFPALFQEAYDQLRDAAGAILFAPAGAKEEP